MNGNLSVRFNYKGFDFTPHHKTSLLPGHPAKEEQQMPCITLQIDMQL